MNLINKHIDNKQSNKISNRLRYRHALERPAYPSLTLRSNYYKGFTLIELLVVISIIAILVAFVSFNFTGTLKSTRDTQRKNDLKTYQTAVESVANKNNGYFPHRPAGSGRQLTDQEICENDLQLDYPCQADPLNSGNHVYRYKTIGVSGASGGDYVATQYLIWGVLEESPSNWWVICSNGKSGLTATNPATTPNADCPGDI